MSLLTDYRVVFIWISDWEYCVTSTQAGAITPSKFKRVEDLFIHLIPIAQDENTKLIFRVPGMSNDFKWFKRLSEKEQHYYLKYKDYEQKLSGHRKLMDNKWNGKIKDSNFSSNYRGNNRPERKLRSHSSKGRGGVSPHINQ